MKTLTTSQIEALLAEARKDSTRDWAMLLVTFRHALRSGEVRSLKVEGIDMNDQNITIRRLKGSRGGTHTLDRHRGKPLLDEVTALRAWLKERVEDGSHILFPSQKGGTLTRMQLLRIFRRYAEAAGVPTDLCHPHILRHSLCSSERQYPVGKDHGYMWRLNFDSRRVERDGGVYLQVEFLALSRTVPARFRLAC